MPQTYANITISVVNALNPGDVVLDKQLRNFGVRRQRQKVSYFVRARIAGKQRWLTLGAHGQPGPDGVVWNPTTARQQALRVLADPVAADKPKPLTEISFATVADRFLTLHGPKLKASTLDEYTFLMNRFLKPAFGEMPLRQITRGDISNAHAGWAKTPRSANHALSVLSKLMSWSEDQGYRDEHSNPCLKVQRYKEEKRERYLTTTELARLGQVLNRAVDDGICGPYCVAAVRLLILTGARLSEILTLRWEHVDIERRMIFLPDSKTGKKPLVLNAAALDVLTSLPRFDGNPFVIVGHRYNSHIVNLHKPWIAIRNAAGLQGVRLHDLRHTFASFAINAGGSLPILGRQLGHANSQTTERYAHLADDPVRRLTQSTGEILAASLLGTVKPPPA